MVKVKAEMDQLKDGLATLGFLKLLISTPREWECYFLTPQKVTAGNDIEYYISLIKVLIFCLDCIKRLLTPEFSTVKKKAEEQAYLYFVNFLQECEGINACTFCIALLALSLSDWVI